MLPTHSAASEGSRPGVRALYVSSLAALFIELLFIRWISSEVPVLAYFKNFTLLAAFVGLGLGCLAAGRRSLWSVSLAALTAALLVVALADRLGLDHLVFPDANVDLWGRLFVPTSAGVAFARNLGAIFAILAATCAAFLGLGQRIGELLAAGPPLRMYSVDILGSLSGVAAFAAVSYFETPPAVWLLGATLLLSAAAAFSGGGLRRGLLPLLGLFAVALIVQLRASGGDSVVRWSPYYRIEVKRFASPKSGTELGFHLSVNRDVHQVALDLSDAAGTRFRSVPDAFEAWTAGRRQYDFPYAVLGRQPRSVLIGGAGTGNDASAALRSGAARVTAVEIDPAIVRLGRELHPEDPYADPRVRVVNTDIRSFTRRTREAFDLVVFGILDSHTALSSLSSLRLDNYVYTVEGLADAYGRLTPDGMLCVSFFESHRRWLGQRIAASLREATGREPVSTRFNQTVFFVVAPGRSPEELRTRLASLGLPPTGLDEVGAAVRPATDDWPFLYANPAGQPLVYYVSLLGIVLAAVIGVRILLRSGAGPRSSASFDWPMFFLGAGFLLVETKALAELALLFGSTWIVNSFVFGGIFVMVLVANAVVRRGPTLRPGIAFALLAASLSGWFLFPRHALAALDYAPRAAVGTVLIVLPIFFAGLVFASGFATSATPEVAFGSNLVGAVVGGAAEATSLVFGIRSLTLLALAFYTLAYLAARRGERNPASVGPPPSVPTAA